MCTAAQMNDAILKTYFESDEAARIRRGVQAARVEDTKLSRLRRFVSSRRQTVIAE